MAAFPRCRLLKATQDAAGGSGWGKQRLSYFHVIVQTGSFCGESESVALPPFIYKKRDAQMFPASLVMVVFWRLSFSKCTYRDLSEGVVIFNE